MSNRATSARYTDIVTSTLKTIGGFSTDVDGFSDLEISGGAKFGNNIDVTGNIVGSIVGPVTGDVTGNVMANFISAATGTLTTVSDDALFNGDITINSLNQDDTETKLVTWNSGDKTVEYVERDNMFGQPLSVTSDTIFNKVRVNESNATGTFPLTMDNPADSLTAHMGVYMTTGCNVGSNGGNMTILMENCGINKWEFGYRISDGTFRWNYGAGYDYLETVGDTQMTLSNVGDLTVKGNLISTPALTQTDGHVATISSTGALTKAIRTAFSTINSFTASSTPIVTQGDYEHINIAGWTEISNLNGDWTSTGAQATYTGTDTGQVMVNGQINFTGTNLDQIFLCLYNGVSQIACLYTYVTNGNTMYLSIGATTTVANGTELSLRITNVTNTNPIQVLCGWMSIVSI